MTVMLLKQKGSEGNGKAMSIRVGLVGAGLTAGLHHLPVLSRLKEARVMAVCDQEDGKAQDLAQRFSIPRVHVSLDEMLQQEGLDLIDICVPPQHHHEMLAKTLSAGLPCLVEKPFTVTTAEADEVIRIARQKGLPIFPIFDHPYFPGVRRAKSLLRQGVIGRVVGVHVSYAEPLPDRYLDPSHWCHSLPGDYFGDAGPHLAMLLVDLLGPVQKVRALAGKTSNHAALPMDELRILARFENGALGSITHSVNCPSSFMTIDIVGTEGLLHANGIFNGVVHYGRRARLGSPWAFGLAFARGILTQTTALAGTAISVLMNRYVLRTEPNAHLYLIPRALRVLQGRGSYPVKLDDARESVRLLELTFDSL